MKYRLKSILQKHSRIKEMYLTVEEEFTHTTIARNNKIIILSFEYNVEIDLLIPSRNCVETLGCPLKSCIRSNSFKTKDRSSFLK